MSRTSSGEGKKGRGCAGESSVGRGVLAGVGGGTVLGVSVVGEVCIDASPGKVA